MLGSNPLTLSGAITGAGSVTNAQTFNGTTIGNGTNQLALTSGGGGTVNLTLGAIARAAGTHGTISVTPAASGTIAASGTLTNGTLGGWATIGADYATINAGNVVAYTGYVDQGATFANLVNGVALPVGLKRGARP